jgi:hypothetical protein
MIYDYVFQWLGVPGVYFVGMGIGLLLGYFIGWRSGWTAK